MISVWHMYKAETGIWPVDEIEVEFSVYRSKGQWILDMSDAEKMDLAGRRDLIKFMKPDEDYILWLENKIEELIKLK